MNVSEAISKFRAVRSYAERPLEPGVLDHILQAGRRAPSSLNLQRWHFVVCTDRAHLQQLSGLGGSTRHIADAAAAIALVRPDARDAREAESIAFDLGQCAENMILAALELGVASAHGTVDDDTVGRELLGYPDGFRCRYLIVLGYPAEGDIQMWSPRKGGRKPLDEIVHRERW